MKTGVLLIQLGTPDAPTTKALRPYLRQFLGDPRVIEVPRLKWWFILNLFILPFRPKQSAAKYQRIWDAQTGSPLLHWTKMQTAALQKLLPDVPLRFGMQVGNPPVERVVDEMIAAGVERLIVLPMYPQYSATTTASATDVLFKALMAQRRVPALRIVPPYYDHPAYLDAMTTVAQFSRHPDQVRRARRPLPDPCCANDGGADRAPRLAARRLDADIPIPVRPRGVAEALYRGETARPGGAGREARVRRHAGLHGGLPGDARRDRPRGPSRFRAGGRRATARLPLPQRSSRVDRGAAYPRDGRGTRVAKGVISASPRVATRGLYRVIVERS